MTALRLAALLALSAAAVAAAGPYADAQSRRMRPNEQPQQQGGEQPSERQEKQFPLGSAWTAVSLNGKPFSGERPSMAVNKQLRATGFSGCNNFSATLYPLRQQNMAVGPFALTRKNCDKAVMASELSFLTALRTASKWDLVAGNLVVKGQNGELRFERAI
jgi:heat shock protein HslJ